MTPEPCRRSFSFFFLSGHIGRIFSCFSGSIVRQVISEIPANDALLPAVSAPKVNRISLRPGILEQKAIQLDAGD
ncbi:hypothetical protein Turpa_3574 [Turneriella parva DSM 21527]|uniref:Uncharacterized protein n=1 Tax=Turneriella parva (strain ATCC BAA-1111 / DSM 21527 / NCTC 11395 / H) TaxID=869212 RepID=I4BAA1_TURPD|nr:hypothetical protein Turpa_3574 [Turneriella parva DSM 21527]